MPTTAPEESPRCNRPLLLFVLVAAATIYGIRRGKTLWGLDLILFSVRNSRVHPRPSSPSSPNTPQ